MPLLVVRNDITRVAADAVVNTANKHVCVGDGVDMAIYQAAGMQELLREREKIGDISKCYLGICEKPIRLPINMKMISSRMISSWA